MSTIVDATEAEYLVEIRREIHRHPELGFEEERTATLVERELTKLGLVPRRVAKTGIVAIIEGALPGATVGLRADMDALPVMERTGLPFASEVAGRMHACGHDAHTAMLIGAARHLIERRDSLHGKVVLFFQPAEEGPGGAQPMIDAGVLENPHVDALAMLHVDVRLKTGVIGLTPGSVAAAADEVHITIEGKGGHGAHPHLSIDAIPAAAATVLALQNIAARETDPLKSVVITIGTIEGGYRNNVIADRVHLTGTMRSHEPEIRNGLEERVRRIVDGVTSAYGARANVKVLYGYPPVINNAALVRWFTPRLAQIENVQVIEAAPTMGGEDFAFFANERPGIMMRLGVRNEELGSIYPGHSPEFKIDEAAIPIGVAALVRFVEEIGEHGVPE